MAVHGNRKIIVLRRTLVADPEHESAVDLELQVKNLAPSPTYLGENSTSGSGHMTGRRRYRLELNVVCWPFVKRALASGEVGQDWSRYLLLSTEIFRTGAPAWYVWLYRCYRIGSNKLLGPIERAMYDPTDWDTVHDGYFNASSETDDGYPYDPPGILPLEVVLDGNLDPSPNNARGVEELSFTLKAANAISD